MYFSKNILTYIFELQTDAKWQMKKKKKIQKRGEKQTSKNVYIWKKNKQIDDWRVELHSQIKRRGEEEKKLFL